MLIKYAKDLLAHIFFKCQAAEKGCVDNCHQNRITCIELCFMYLTFSVNADSAFNTVVYHHTKTCFLLLIDCNLFTFYKKKMFR